MTDREFIEAELQKLQKILEDKADVYIGIDNWNKATNLLSFATACSGALELLKEQEPKPVKVVKTESDYKLYYCPRCDRPFCDFYYVKPKFCDKCGQAVKWE